MRTIVLSLVLFALLALPAQAQTDISSRLAQRDGATKLFFYKNTLRMINVSKNEAFDELIKNIDKVRYVTVPIERGGFTLESYDALLTEIKGEGFEELMNMRQADRFIDAYLKGASEQPDGFIVTIRTEDDLTMLDMKGLINPTQVGGLMESFQKFDIGRFLKGN